ncbi:hypothetical protein DSY14_07840 [Nocardiopsis sp. MG754419]|nr:hypothetical protein [Nocardiopsis sp. MG754419]
MTRPDTRVPGLLPCTAAVVLLLTGCADGSGPVITESATSSSPEQTPPPPADPAAWADERFGAFEEVVFEGTSSERLELPDQVRDAGAMVLDVVYEDGGEELMLFTLDADERFSEVLLDTFLPITGDDEGSFSGQALSVGEAALLAVEADGAWSVTLRPASSAPELPGAGSGHGVFLYSGPGGDVGVRGTGAEGGLAVQEVGGQATVPSRAAFLQFEELEGGGSLAPGPSLVHVTHNGDWSLVLP